MKEYFKDRNSFIAWIKFQRRASSMQPFFEYELKFVPAKFESRSKKILDYVYKAFASIFFLIRKKPKLLWVQLPPTPLLRLALWYRTMFKGVIVVADCHNGLFGNKWGKYLKKGKYLNKANLILVHNHVIKEIAIDMGLDPTRLLVLETKPAFKSNKAYGKSILQIENSWILMPCGFAEDEPIATVFEAAKRIPEITIVISGNKSRAEGKHDLSIAPDNVMFTGYLSKEQYENVFAEAPAVLGLTTEHHVQLSVANEATGFEKPMILSDTPLLRELFGRGTVFVDNHDSNSMANGIKQALETRELLEDEVKLLKKERNEKWQNQAEQVKQKIISEFQINI